MIGHVADQPPVLQLLIRHATSGVVRGWSDSRELIEEGFERCHDSFVHEHLFEYTGEWGILFDEFWPPAMSFKCAKKMRNIGEQ